MNKGEREGDKVVYVKLNETVHGCCTFSNYYGSKKNINGNAAFYEAAELFHIKYTRKQSNADKSFFYSFIFTKYYNVPYMKYA